MVSTVFQSRGFHRMSSTVLRPWLIASWLRRSKVSRRLFTSTLRVFTADVHELNNGGGPFLSSTFGNPSTLLSISVPDSGDIFVAQSSILGITGDINFVHRESKLLHGVTYHKLTSSSLSAVAPSAVAPSTLLVGGRRNNYTILDLAEQWQVLDVSRVVAWTGVDTEIEIEKVELLMKRRSLKLSGAGSLVLKGNSEMARLNVKENEEAYINPNALIAVAGLGANDLKKDLLTVPTYELHQLEISHFSWPQFIVDPVHNFRKDALAKLSEAKTYLRQYYEPLVPYITYLSKGLGNLWYKLYTQINGKFIRKKPIYIKISGPCSALFENQPMLHNSDIFTNKEINDVYK